jgi:hypothetical protein
MKEKLVLLKPIYIYIYIYICKKNKRAKPFLLPLSSLGNQKHQFKKQLLTSLLNNLHSFGFVELPTNEST